MELVKAKIRDVVPYENNPRVNDGAVDAVAESIRQCGYVSPIIVDEDMVILAGHTRFKALQRLGWDEVSVGVARGLTEEQKRKYRVLDNKTNEFAQWDVEKLLDELDGLDFDGFDFGFGDLETEIETEDALSEDIDDVEESENDDRDITQGQVWMVGEHRLMCGDSTSESDIDKLIGGAMIDIVLTDPPYGISAVERSGHSSGAKAGNQIARDNVYMPIKGDGTTETARAFYELIRGKSKTQIIFGGNYFTDFLPPSRCWIVWDKDVAGSFADGELAWVSKDHNLKIYKQMWSGMRREGDRETELAKRVHPTQKPVGLLIQIMDEFSGAGETVLDAFGGSGSTLIACEKTGRKCFMMEYEPHYVGVIIDRWEKLTGNKAVLLSE